MSPKIIIAGTGRAGTSFLMRLLTRLGFDTGYTPAADGFNPNIRAGCEYTWSPRNLEWFAGAPQVLKSPYWCEDLQKALALGLSPTDILHVFIPVRSITEVARSRLDAGLAQHPKKTLPAESCLMARWLGRIVETVVLNQIALTFLAYPRFIDDWSYCRDRLAEGLPEIGEIVTTHFRRTHQTCSLI